MPASSFDPKTYRGRRVLIVGASGFIGRWVARALSAAGAKLLLVGRDAGVLGEVCKSYQIRGTLIEANLAHSGAFAKLFYKLEPEVTFNLAGYGIEPAEDDPSLAEALNSRLVAEMAETISASDEADWAGLRLVHAGTAAEYGHLQGGLAEDSPTSPASLYGRTKLGGTQALVAACERDGLRAVTARLFTVYGPGEHRGRLLPSLLAAAQSGTTLPLTRGEQRRDFTFVGDVAEGLLRLGSLVHSIPSIVNLATGRLTSVREFVLCAAELLGLQPSQVQFGALPYRSDELQQGPADTRMLQEILCWVPSCSIREGIQQTIHFQDRLSGVRMFMTATLSSAQPAVSVVMPCYNEESCLRQTASELVQAFSSKNIPLQLILVNNGSRDRTGMIIDELIAQGMPITKVTVPVNLGYGQGVLEGLKHCQAPLVGYLCADGQVTAEEAVKTYEQARTAGEPVLAKVRRRFRKDSWRRKLVSILYNFAMPLVFGWLGSIDLNASPKVLPRESLLAMRLESKDWFLDPEVMIKARHLGLKVLERDVEGLARAGGKSNVRYTTCLQFVKNIMRYRFGSALRKWQESLKAMPATGKACGESNRARWSAR